MFVCKRQTRVVEWKGKEMTEEADGFIYLSFFVIGWWGIPSSMVFIIMRRFQTVTCTRNSCLECYQTIVQSCYVAPIKRIDWWRQYNNQVQGFLSFILAQKLKVLKNDLSVFGIKRSCCGRLLF